MLVPPAPYDMCNAMSTDAHNVIKLLQVRVHISETCEAWACQQTATACGKRTNGVKKRALMRLLERFQPTPLARFTEAVD